MSIKLYDSMTKRKKVVSLLAFFLVLAVHNGYAKDESAKQEPLSVTLSAQKVRMGDDGKETFSTADKVQPGDIVQYSAVYRNRSKNSVTKINASLPVPFGMEYVGMSARPKSGLATADGVKFAAEPLMRTIKDKDGKERQIAVPYAEYQSLRWTISSLDAGKRQEVSARMRVNELPKTPEELVTKPVVPATKP